MKDEGQMGDGHPMITKAHLEPMTNSNLENRGMAFIYFGEQLSREQIGLDTRKSVFRVCDCIRLNLACLATKTS